MFYTFESEEGILVTTNSKEDLNIYTTIYLKSKNPPTLEECFIVEKLGITKVLYINAVAVGQLEDTDTITIKDIALYNQITTVFSLTPYRHTGNSKKQSTGLSTDYYDIFTGCTDVDSVCVKNNMSFPVGTILKSVVGVHRALVDNETRHSGTDINRDLNKIIHYATLLKKDIHEI